MARVPIAWVSCRTTVIRGWTNSPTATSSKPIRATWWDSPACCRASTAPVQITLRPAKIAVGGSSRASSSRVAWTASSRVRRSTRSRCGVGADPEARSAIR